MTPDRHGVTILEGGTMDVVRVGVRELRARLNDYLRAAQKGDTVVVTRNGRDVAVIGQAGGSPGSKKLLRTAERFQREAAEDAARAAQEAAERGAHLKLVENERDAALAAYGKAVQTMAALREENAALREELANHREMIGTSPASRRRWGRAS